MPPRYVPGSKFALKNSGVPPKYKPAGRQEQYKPAGPAKTSKKSRPTSVTYKGKTWVGAPKPGKAGSRGMTNAMEQWINTHLPDGSAKMKSTGKKKKKGGLSGKSG